MFDKTGQTSIDVSGKTYHVGRMGPIISADISKILISGKVMPFLQIEDMTGAVIMAMMDLPDDKLKTVSSAVLEKSKGPDGSQVTQLSFNGDITAYWQLVAKVLFANFTELALYLEVEKGKLAEYAKAAAMARKLQKV
mgnify:CR=1 FL=1|tara:strand:- start:36353 stop:36766 length:414 start_codon:yes stop_codon:yes gene_type:complete